MKSIRSLKIITLLQKQEDDLTAIKAKIINVLTSQVASTLENGTNGKIISTRTQMLDQINIFKKLRDTQLFPILLNLLQQLVLYQLNTVNKDTDHIAVFVNLQQCCV